MERNTDAVREIILQSGIEELTRMQEQAIQSAGEEKEIILSAPTGSGKTIAFLGMLLKMIPETPTGTYALIVTPTRELALQITGVFQSLKTGYKVTACYGGHRREIEENSLQEAPALIIGTPGRIGDHIRRKNIKVENINLLILDEYDKSLEMGFLEEIGFIYSSLENLKRKILVSATTMAEWPSFLDMSKVIHLNFDDTHIPAIELNLLHYKSREDKFEKLLEALCTIGNRRTIIFVNQKETVAELSQFISGKGIYNVRYHGSLEQQERETAIAKFKNGTSLFLVTTDLASRGMDVPHVRYIIHFDLPESETIFKHRNGRTARMESSGDAIIMVSESREKPDYIHEDIPEFGLLPDRPVPDKTEWSTIYISAGKKNKVNKIDIAGFLMQTGGLKREDTGIIEVKDFYSFAAIRRSKMNALLGKGQVQKIKNKKVRIDVAR